jgi:hypothetical protein
LGEQISTAIAKESGKESNESHGIAYQNDIPVIYDEVVASCLIDNGATPPNNVFEDVQNMQSTGNRLSQAYLETVSRFRSFVSDDATKNKTDHDMAIQGTGISSATCWTHLYHPEYYGADINELCKVMQGRLLSEELRRQLWAERFMDK